MGPTWTDPLLGTFEYDHDDEAWVATVKAPGFDRFCYNTGYSNAGPPTGEYRLRFVHTTAAAPPSGAPVALARRVLADPAKLVTTIQQALWDDFTGQEPGSPMWWHGDLDEVGSMSGGEPPAGPDDLLRMMRLCDIVITTLADYPTYEPSDFGPPEVKTSDEPIAELRFWAQFEEEHDVGVLTDGVRVLGLGYAGEITPFSPPEQP
jgi:hypothetical protein